MNWLLIVMVWTSGLDESPDLAIYTYPTQAACRQARAEWLAVIDVRTLAACAKEEG